MKISIKNSQRKIKINKRLIWHLAQKVLKIKGIKKAELSIFFVGKKRMASLNKRFRKVDRVTDVLAFSMREGKTRLHPEVLGDVVVCPQMAERAARLYQTDQTQELYLYLIHGILHLLGYRDTRRQNRLLMKREQTKIFQLIKR